MNRSLTLRITSLISILLFISHWADEVSRGMEAPGLSGLGGILILVVWLYATLALADRRAGVIIMLVGGILGLGVLILHMTGRGYIGGRITANSAGAFFWSWVLIALGVNSAVSAILAAQGLWTRSSNPQS